MEKFIKFLEDNNAWENFERAFLESGKNVKNYKERCKKLRNEELSGAFAWAGTKEGYEYWDKLNCKWIEENKSLRRKLSSDD